MNKYDYDIGIIGGGAAGLTVASGAAQLGAKTLLVEQEDRLGGDCLHYRLRAFQNPDQQRPHLFPDQECPSLRVAGHRSAGGGFQTDRHRIRQVIDTIQPMTPRNGSAGLGVKWNIGRPRFTDEHGIDLDGQHLSAKQWVIATGSSPMIPAHSRTARHAAFWTNRDLFSLDRLPESLIILGAGPIGIEMAQAFTRLGARVAVIDRADQILVKEDRDLADELMAVMAGEGIDFHLKAEVTAVGGSRDNKVVRFNNDHGVESRLEARALLVAVGRVANTRKLGLEAIGVETHKSRYHGGPAHAHQPEAHFRCRRCHRRFSVHPCRRI